MSSDLNQGQRKDRLGRGLADGQRIEGGQLQQFARPGAEHRAACEVVGIAVGVRDDGQLRRHQHLVAQLQAQRGVYAGSDGNVGRDHREVNARAADSDAAETGGEAVGVHVAAGQVDRAAGGQVDGAVRGEHAEARAAMTAAAMTAALRAATEAVHASAPADMAGRAVVAGIAATVVASTVVAVAASTGIAPTVVAVVAATVVTAAVVTAAVVAAAGVAVVASAGIAVVAVAGIASTGIAVVAVAGIASAGVAVVTAAVVTVFAGIAGTVVAAADG